MVLRTVFSVLLAVGLVVGGGWLYYFYPHYLVQFKMSSCVGDAALTWGAFTMQRGKQQLVQSMKDRDIEDEVDTELECKFYEESGDKWVECEWERIIEVPVLGARRLVLYEAAGCGPDGRLVGG